MTQFGDLFTLGSDADRRLAKQMREELLVQSRRARATSSYAYGGGGFRMRRSARVARTAILVAFFLVFLIPSLLAVVYIGWLQSDQFETESHFFIVDNSEQSQSALGSLMSLGSNSAVNYVYEYIRSLDMLADLEKRVDLAEVYGSGRSDPLSRLHSDASRQDLLKYWRRHIDIEQSSFRNQISLKVWAFTSQDSLEIHEAVLDAAEARINSIMSGIRSTRLAEAEAAVDSARAELENRVENMRKTREEFEILDAEISAEGVENLLTALRERKAVLDQRIGVIRERAPRSPQVVELQAQSDALDLQIEQVTAAQTSSSDSRRSLAVGAAQLDLRQTEVDAARAELLTSLAGYESARAEAELQAMFIQRSVQPVLPQEATYPRRVLHSISFVLASLLAWGVLTGLIIVIRDNRS